MKQTKPSERNIIRITDADQLQTLLDAPLEVRFNLGGKTFVIEVTALSPQTAEQVRALRRKARPQWKKELGTGGDYDLMDPKYQEERDTNERKARALMIYSHCPAVAAKKPGLVAIDQIYAHVQNMWRENVLELVAAKIMAGGISLEEQVNFTSTPGSES